MLALVLAMQLVAGEIAESRGSTPLAAAPVTLNGEAHAPALSPGFPLPPLEQTAHVAVSAALSFGTAMVLKHVRLVDPRLAGVVAAGLGFGLAIVFGAVDLLFAHSNLEVAVGNAGGAVLGGFVFTLGNL